MRRQHRRDAPAGPREATEALRRHLVASGLAGRVATSPRSTIQNCAKMAAGHDDYHFGMSDWRTATADDALDAVRALCGVVRTGPDELDGPGWIDPELTLLAVERHRRALAALAAAGGARVLLATGHPTGLLAHYTAVARALQSAGSELLTPLDDVFVRHDERGRPRGVRFTDGVACLFDGAALLHTHRSVYMEAMLDALDGRRPDLVVGDHGMAGTAVERGIPALSIADVNDPALPVAQVRGRTDGVLCIDDNLAPRLFVPVTEAVLRW